MTSILICDGKVLHDSSADLYGFKTTRLNKVTPAPLFRVRSRRDGFEDTIVGTGGSGPGEILDEFFRSCRAAPIDNVVDTYDWAREKGLMNDGNQFTACMIGVKGLVLVEVDRGSTSVSYTPHSVAQMSFIGSCTNAMEKLAKERSNLRQLDLSRLMYACFAMEPTCYGYVSAYEVVGGAKPHLKWVGLNNLRTQAEIRVIASRLDQPYPFDLYGDKGALPWAPITIEQFRKASAPPKKRKRT